MEGKDMLRLHYHPASTYARRVRIALSEKGIPCELVTVDMANRRHREPEFRAMNPYGRVPVLEEDGFVLYESTAILQYLEATHPQPPLVPGDQRGRALVDMHMRLCDLQMARPAGLMIFPKRFLPKERWDEKVMEAAKKDVDRHLEILEGQLQGQEYLVAGRFTLAEVCYIPFLQFLSLMDVIAPPAVGLWSARILARPSAVETRPG
jgi:glutathione S-transferase